MNPIHAPHGNTRTAKGWIQEAAKRMLMNNLDPDVAEKPEELIVYGGRGKAARNWAAYHRIVATLDRLENDETLLIQSGKPVGVLRTHDLAPRVILANSNLVPKWATWEEFDRLDQLGLMMYGQMTAGSWIYIGTQGILQGTYETFAAAADKHFNGTLAGTITVTAGLGGMGGAQPLAVSLAGGVSICIEVDPARIERRLETRYLDEVATTLDMAISRAHSAKGSRQALSIGLLGNAAESRPQDGAPKLHPATWSPIRPLPTTRCGATSRRPGRTRTSTSCAPSGPRSTSSAPARRWSPTSRRSSRCSGAAPSPSTMATTSAPRRRLGGLAEAFGYPGFVPAFIRDSFCEGRGPFRWVALSGDPADIAATDAALRTLFPHDKRLQQWLGWAGDRIAFQGLPAGSAGSGTRNATRPG